MLTHLQAPPTPPSRLVVIGSGGFIGGAIAGRAERAGCPVLRVTRREADLLAPDAAGQLAALLREGDTVVTAAAMAPCKTAGQLRDNLTLAMAMAEAFRLTAPAHVVNIGSDAVFADGPLPLTEASPKAPDSYHGVMHLAREVLFRTEIQAPLATLRPTLVYGAGDPHDGYGPNRFRRLANRGEPIRLFGEGEERRDHVSVDDVAELAWNVVLHRSTGNLNIATGTVTSFRDVAELAVELAVEAGGRPVAIAGSPRSGPMPHNGYRPFDVSAVVQAFPGFQFTPLRDGMADAQRLERSNG